jgi:hypothetical protein
MRRIPGLQAFDPRAIGVDGDGRLVLQLDGGNFSRLSPRFSPVSMFGLKDKQVRKAADPDRGIVDRVYSPWAVTDDDIAFCADVQVGEGWKTGYLSAPLSNLNDFGELSVTDSKNNPQWVYCRTGMRFIATASGGNVYLLLGEDKDGDGVEDATSIRHFVIDGAQIKSSKAPLAEFGPRPRLESYVKPEDFARTMGIIERATMPYGLFASTDGKTLYVLERTPDGKGTRWSLQAVDASDGERFGRAELPSRSSHLTVVPGPDAWAFLERSAPVSFKDFASQGLRLLPTSEIAGLRTGSSTLCR